MNFLEYAKTIAKSVSDDVVYSDSNKIPLHVSFIDFGAKKNLFFMHDLGSSSMQVMGEQAVMEILDKKEYNLLFWDHQGHGLSGGERGELEDIEILINDFEKILKSYGKKKEKALFCFGRSFFIYLELYKRFGLKEQIDFSWITVGHFQSYFERKSEFLIDNLKRPFVNKLLALKLGADIRSFDIEKTQLSLKLLTDYKDLQKRSLESLYFIESPLFFYVDDENYQQELQRLKSCEAMAVKAKCYIEKLPDGRLSLDNMKGLANLL